MNKGMNKTLLVLAVFFAVIIAVTAFALLVMSSPLLTQKGDMSQGPATSPAPAAAEVAYARITQGMHANVNMRVNYLIRSADDLASLWQALGDAGRQPAVDFTQYAVLALFAGQVPNPGYTITASKITDTAVNRLVSITLTSPGAGCFEPQVIATPYELVLVPRTSLPLAHEDITAIVDCQ